MFQFPGFASIAFTAIDDRLSGQVAPFGHFRIKGCLTPPRNLSQSCHVLLRLLEPRHPPYALRFPAKKPKNALIYPVAENYSQQFLLNMQPACIHIKFLFSCQSSVVGNFLSFPVLSSSFQPKTGNKKPLGGPSGQKTITPMLAYPLDK